jgi:hypothetical protein
MAFLADLRAFTLLLAAMALLAPVAVGLQAPPSWPLPHSIAPPPAGYWNLQFSASWEAAPDAIGLAAHIPITPNPSPSFHSGVVQVVPGDIRMADITTLAFDAFIPAGGCGEGAPRLEIELLANHHDVDHNPWIFVYAGSGPGFTQCENGVWKTHDLLDGAPRFDVTHLVGGPTFTDLPGAQTAAGDLPIIRARFTYGKPSLTTESELWLDNLRLNCYTLGEPVDVGTSVAMGAVGC